MIPIVKIDSSGMFKYIVSLMAESVEDYIACRGTIFVRGNNETLSHYWLEQDLCDEAKKAGLKIPMALGGGYIEIDPEKRVVKKQAFRVTSVGTWSLGDSAGGIDRAGRTVAVCFLNTCRIAQYVC